MVTEMRTENIKVKLTMPIPFDKPDLNGNVYRKEAIEKALNDFNHSVPLIYRGNDEDSVDKVIGVANAPAADVVWDDEQQVCKIEIDGNIFYGGVSGIVNEMKGNAITDFTIVSVGFGE